MKTSSLLKKRRVFANAMPWQTSNQGIHFVQLQQGKLSKIGTQSIAPNNFRPSDGR
jgi:hypothetical protein